MIKYFSGKPMAFTILLITMMTAIAGMIVREIVLSTRRREEYSLRRLTLRIVMALMLIFLLASMLVGVRIYGLDKPRDIELWMAFWGCIALLSGAVVCLAIADMRMIGTETHADTNRIWRDIAQMIAEHEQKKTGADKQADEHEPKERDDTGRPTDGGD